jgi:hypothetical protein
MNRPDMFVETWLGLCVSWLSQTYPEDLVNLATGTSSSASADDRPVLSWKQSHSDIPRKVGKQVETLSRGMTQEALTDSFRVTAKVMK